MGDEQYEVDGILTDVALKRLSAAMPEVPADQFVSGLRVTEVPELIYCGDVLQSGCSFGGRKESRRLRRIVEGSRTELPRFAFLVHPLMGWHRRFIGVRGAKLGLAAGYRDGSSAWDIAPLCELELVGVAKGVMMAIPMTPDQLLGDQDRVLQRLFRAVEVAKTLGPLDAVGLGALCAVVAGRGSALGAQLDIPVTTGAAATAWTLAENTRTVVNQIGEALLQWWVQREWWAALSPRN